jgi:CheY-like chemotaxis protein
VGLAPLRLGEILYARTDDNGISGYVAATGQAYLCRDIRRDTRYYDGLPNARSSLTVPLRLNDAIIGVFNIEADTADAFDEEDRRFAELFGRYIAMAMHILDLLVVERYTSNAQAGENIIGELDAPLADITRAADVLLARLEGDPEASAELETILASAGGIRDRLRECAEGPRSLLGADRANVGLDPRLSGKRIIIADNETVTRDAIAKLLRGQGCQVTACPSGSATIDALRQAAGDSHPFDLVISDIRMPDGNGYDVFRSAKELSAALPVILITGFGYDPDHCTVRAAEDGVAALLFKPLKAAQLLEAVATAVDSA